MKTVAFHTLGCKVNQYESTMLAEVFRQQGYQIVAFDRQSDVYVINTCTVTHQSDRKCRQVIRKAIKHNPESVVAVIGCYSQVSPAEIAEIPGVDIVVGTDKRNTLPELVAQVKEEKKPINVVSAQKGELSFEDMPWSVEAGRARAFLKIQEGCQEYCSYCIIPYARGNLRSKNPDSIIKVIKDIVAKGYKELIMSGTHLGAYGRDLQNNINLAALLSRIEKETDLYRLRLSSLEPVDLKEELIETISSSKIICRHLHVPLQSGDNEILKKMKRPYTIQEYRKIIDQIKVKMPNIALTTDVIVGFPGETEEKFSNTYNLIKEIAFSDLHDFKYSPRKGTPAASFPEKVDPQLKSLRSEKLRDLAQDLNLQYSKKFINTKQEIIIEKTNKEGLLEGFTDNYLRIFLTQGEKEIKKGTIVTVKIEEIKGNKLIGAIK